MSKEQDQFDFFTSGFPSRYIDGGSVRFPRVIHTVSLSFLAILYLVFDIELYAVLQGLLVQ